MSKKKWKNLAWMQKRQNECIPNYDYNKKLSSTYLETFFFSMKKIDQTCLRYHSLSHTVQFMIVTGLMVGLLWRVFTAALCFYKLVIACFYIPRHFVKWFRGYFFSYLIMNINQKANKGYCYFVNIPTDVGFLARKKFKFWPQRGWLQSQRRPHWSQTIRRTSISLRFPWLNLWKNSFVK